MTQVRPCRDLFLVEEGHHRHVGGTEHEHHELGFDVIPQVRRLIVHDVESRFPERLPRLDRVGLLAFEFEEDLAIEHVPEYGTRVTVRPGAGITRWDGDRRDHGAGVRGYLRVLVQQNVEGIGRRGADRWHAPNILGALAGIEGHSEVEDVGQSRCQLSRSPADLPLVAGGGVVRPTPGCWDRHRQSLPTRLGRAYRGGMDVPSEIREFLGSRRARISPEQAGLPAYGGNRRVKGLRREEVAMLAGVSVDYYVRMERGSLAGASETVLDALASALQLDEAERDHLFALARASGPTGSRRKRKTTGTLRPALQQILDAITDAPAWIRNGRHDVLAMNQLARALYAPVLADPRRPANTTRFVYLHPDEAERFFVDYDQITRDAAAMLRLEAGSNPHDEQLIALVGELSTRSELFRQRWASQDVRFHRSGRKRLNHPVVGQLDLDFEAMALPSEPGLQLNVYTAAANTPTADGLKLLASWAASQENLPSEVAPTKD